MPGDSIWSEVVPAVVDEIESHRTTLVFCNSRRLAERTADRINEHRLLRKLGGAAVGPRLGAEDVGMFAAGVDAQTLEAAGLEPIRAHHGSMSRVDRFAMEGALK